MNSAPPSFTDVDVEGIIEPDPELDKILEKYDDVLGSIVVPATSLSTLAIRSGSDRVACEKLREVQLTARNKKSWHTKRREEILRLRDEVKELTAILKQQKASAAVVSKQLARRSFDKKTLSWQELANWELARRQKSEKENVELREIFKCSLLEAKADHRLLKRRMVATVPHDLNKRYHLTVRDFCPSTGNRDVLNALVDGMDEIYADLNNVFERAKVYELPCPSRRNDSGKNRSKGVYAELFDSYAVPFDIHQVGNAVWALKTNSAGIVPDSIFSECFAAGDNTWMSSVCICDTRHGFEMRVVIHSAVRKYIERDRTIFISRMLVEPIHNELSITFKSTTRLVLKRGRPSATGPTTVMLNHCHVIDRVKVPSTRSRWEASSYFDVGIKAWEHSLTHFYHRVEDICCAKRV